MPTRERLQSLINYVLAGKSVEACEEFYADDVVTQENDGDECVGIAANVARQKERMGQVGEVVDMRCDSYVLDGDRVAINWVLEAVSIEGHRFVLDEIAYQRWRGDEIVRERFYYNPSGF